MSKEKNTGIGFFEKYLTLWVALCMVAGVLIGKFLPGIPDFLGRFEYAQVSIPIAVLIWLMIYPMMMKVDFASIKNVGKNPKGLYVTWVTNWLIKPFTMFGIAWFFFYVVWGTLIPTELAKDYLAGAILLGSAPCTAMVFVWSYLTKGRPAYTVVQVATNDLIILVAFTPIVAFLLGVGGVSIPWDTLILSVVLFVVIPLSAGITTRVWMIRHKGSEYFEQRFIPKFNNITIIGLLLTLIIIFSFQGEVILSNPIHIILIAIPLILQTFLIFFIAYATCKLLGLPYDIAAPAGMIGASNFFELAVAVAISLFGATSPVALATIVGVLVEVPVMLTLVRIANKTRHWFTEEKSIYKPKVAFICVHNSCRSQIAEALGKHLAGDVFESHSAGTETKPQINQDAVRLMKQLYGIDMEETQRPKLLSEIPTVDIVVTMGCNVTCPYLPCKHREDWGLDDPAGKSDEEFIAAIREIESKIRQLSDRIRNDFI